MDSKEFVPTLFPNVLISTKISEDKERLVQAIRANDGITRALSIEIAQLTDKY